MRVVISDDDGNELAQGQVVDLTINGQTLHVDISADVTPSWHALPDGGQSASAGVARLMEHIISNGKALVRYSSVKYSSGPAGTSSPVASAAAGAVYDMFSKR